MDTTPASPIYPIERPATGDGARFTIGLAIDVAAVLHHWGISAHHHRPRITRLQQALFAMIYQEKGTP